MKVGLVSPILNNFDQAIDFIYSARTKENELKIYIQPQYRFQKVVSSAWNNGVRQAVEDGCDYIIISNDDVIFAPYSIDHLVEVANSSQEDEVVVYPRDVMPYYRDNEEDPFMITFSSPDDIFGVPFDDHQSYSCFMIKKDFFEKCGTFDENFDPTWWEDTDMKYRIHLLGLKNIESEVPIVHLGSQSTKKLTIPLNSQKSGEYYVRKWGSANRNLSEVFTTPYNDNSLTPREWRKL